MTVPNFTLTDLDSRLNEFEEQHKEKETKLRKYIGKGRNVLKDQKYKKAASYLGRATDIASSVYGTKDLRTLESHYHFGVALLGLIRRENGVFGVNGDNTTANDDDDSDITDSEDDDEESGEAEEGEYNEPAKAKDDASLTKKSSDDEVAVAGGSNTSENATGTHNDNEDSDSEDEPNNLEIALSIFEHCRELCEACADNEAEIALAEVLISLGECACEANDFEKSLVLAEKAVHLREKHFGDGRQLTEAHFWMGKSAMLLNRFDLAAECFQNAVNSLEKKIVNLKNAEQPDEAAIADLEEVVKEVKAYYEDAKGSDSQKSNIAEARKTVVDTLKNYAVTTLPTAPPDGKLGALIEIRRGPKRKASDDGAETEVTSKKMKEDATAPQTVNEPDDIENQPLKVKTPPLEAAETAAI